MKQTHKSERKRNIVAFEAPRNLSEQAQQIADRDMVSVSAIYRQAVRQFIFAQSSADKAPEFVRF